LRRRIKLIFLDVKFDFTKSGRLLPTLQTVGKESKSRAWSGPPCHRMALKSALWASQRPLMANADVMFSGAQEWGNDGLMRSIHPATRVANGVSSARQKLIFAHSQRENTLQPAMKKQQIRVKKSLFRLEIRFFSSSIAMPVQKQFFAGD